MVLMFPNNTGRSSPARSTDVENARMIQRVRRTRRTGPVSALCLAVATALASCGSSKEAEQHLVLEVHEPPNHAPRIVATNPDATAIKRAIEGLKWDDITFVVLKYDDDNWIEGSGSLRPDDGLSARYVEGGNEYISARPPESLDEIVRLLESYRSGDGRWRAMIEWQ